MQKKCSFADRQYFFIIIRVLVYFTLIFFAIFLRWHNSVSLILDPDSIGYLEPGLELLNNGHLTHSQRSYPYPIFLYTILSFIKNINAILYIQHALAILVLLGSIFFLEKEIRDIEYKSNKLLIFFLGIFALIGCFWNPSLILYEKHLRPEGILLPSFFLICYLLFAYVKKVKQGAFSIKIFFVIIAYAVFSAYLHPRMSLAFYFICFFLLIHFGLYARQKIYKKLLTCLFSLLIVFVIVYPERYLVNKFDQTSDLFAYKQFFFGNLEGISSVLNEGDFIDKEFDQNYLKEIIQRTYSETRNRESFPILKYDLDFAQYKLYPEYHERYDKDSLSIKNKIIEAQIQKIENENREANKQDTIAVQEQFLKNNYFQDWFELMITKHPLKVTKKTGTQIYYVLFSPKIRYINTSENNIASSFDETSPQYPYLIQNLQYQPKIINMKRFPRIFEVAFYYLNYGIKYLVLLGLFFYLYQLFRLKIDLFDLLLVTIFVATSLTVAFLHTFDNPRYSESLMPSAFLFSLLSLYRIMKRH